MAGSRVLLVDDHSDTLRLFETYLSLAGFDVTAVTNARDAIWDASNGFDAVATDLAMPGMDGFEFIRLMRTSRTKPVIPIVAVTGQAVDANATTRSQVDCCRLLLKPCNLEQLAGVLRLLIRDCTHDCAVCPQRTDKILLEDPNPPLPLL